MILTIANVIYVLVAVAMIAFILLQRGAGAAAGSGFGGGASATVFGARGAANFLSKSTAILATLFFIISLGMAMYASRGERAAPSEDLGIMSGVAADQQPAAPAGDVPSLVPAPGAEPAAGEVPMAPATDSAVPAAADTPAPQETAPEGDGNG